MKLHNTPLGFFVFFTKPQYVSYKRNYRNLNEMITSLHIKLSIDYADMQKAILLKLDPLIHFYRSY